MLQSEDQNTILQNEGRDTRRQAVQARQDHVAPKVGGRSAPIYNTGMAHACARSILSTQVHKTLSTSCVPSKE